MQKFRDEPLLSTLEKSVQVDNKLTLAGNFSLYQVYLCKAALENPHC